MLSLIKIFLIIVFSVLLILTSKNVFVVYKDYYISKQKEKLPAVIGAVLLLGISETGLLLLIL
jgi:Ca2+/Na+ antiporter